MRFYDALQLDPSVLKQEIRKSNDPSYKRKISFAILTRSVLIVLFAIALIGPVGPIFGQENSCMAVALFCIMLGIRFVDFGYCIKDAMINLGISFLLLLFAPVLATAAGPFFGFFIHFAAIFLILMITTDQPELGNGGLYTFAYIFLSGNPVFGELLWQRVILTGIGYVLCGSLYFMKHRKKNSSVKFHHLARQFCTSIPKCRWQLKMALGLSAFLAIGTLFNMKRMMWGAFACGSMLGCYSSSTEPVNAEPVVRERVYQRMIGVVAGSALFFIIYKLVPPSLHMLFGPMGGICMGLCTKYRYKTTFNCIGALMMAVGLYGLEGSVMLRIVNNLIGAIFGYAFSVLYQKIMDRHIEPIKE